MSRTAEEPMELHHISFEAGRRLLENAAEKLDSDEKDILRFGCSQAINRIEFEQSMRLLDAECHLKSIIACVDECRSQYAAERIDVKGETS